MRSILLIAVLLLASTFAFGKSFLGQTEEWSSQTAVQSEGSSDFDEISAALSAWENNHGGNYFLEEIVSGNVDENGNMHLHVKLQASNGDVVSTVLDVQAEADN